jgi:hypothetical protein
VRVPSSRIREALGWTGAAAWLAAWFLPALAGTPGWKAFRLALAPLVPYAQASFSPGQESIPQVLSALTNVAFVVLFLLWRTGQAPRPGMFLRLTLLCLLINLYWLVMAARERAVGELGVGYFVWLAAFALLTAVAVLAALSAASARRTSKTPTGGTPA